MSKLKKNTTQLICLIEFNPRDISVKLEAGV